MAIQFLSKSLFRNLESGFEHFFLFSSSRLDSLDDGSGQSQPISARISPERQADQNKINQSERRTLMMSLL